MTLSISTPNDPAGSAPGASAQAFTRKDLAAALLIACAAVAGIYFLFMHYQKQDAKRDMANLTSFAAEYACGAMLKVPAHATAKEKADLINRDLHGFHVGSISFRADVLSYVPINPSQPGEAFGFALQDAKLRDEKWPAAYVDALRAATSTYVVSVRGDGVAATETCANALARARAANDPLPYMGDGAH
jgi:hypothetical protein